VTDDAKGMPERVWVCDSVRAAVRGLHAERIPWRYDPTATDATEYILASRFTALEAELHDASEAAYIYADMPKLRDRIQKMKDDMTYWHDQAMEHSALRDRSAERVTALEAENERLRKALLRISSATVDDALKTAVAREALAADPPKPEKEAG